MPRVLTAFTATATPPVLRRMREVLFPAGGAHLVAGNPDRPNIRYAVAPTAAPLHRLTELVATCPRPLIMFARSRRGVEAACWQLRRRLPEVSCRFYHAGLNAAERKRLEQWYLDSDDGALMATSAYGMGVDKPNIRTVVHLELPESVEAYLQETGRAGATASRRRRFCSPISRTGAPYPPVCPGAAAGGGAAPTGAAQLRRGCRHLPPRPVAALLPPRRGGVQRLRRVRPRRGAAAAGRAPPAAGAATGVAALYPAPVAPHPARRAIAGDRTRRAAARAGLRTAGGLAPRRGGGACAALVAASLARVPARGPWRGRLVVRRQRAPQPPELFDNGRPPRLRSARPRDAE